VRCARAVVEYDGTAFAGSQRQPQQRTVQGELEEALNRLTGERATVRFAGRTDAGVHATAQVVAFCLPGATAAGWSWDQLQRRLNAVLPADVAVRRLRQAATGFDPRRHAVERSYRYRIRDAGRRSPLDRHRTLELDVALDVQAMQAAAAMLIGEHDFAAFGTPPGGGSTRRRVTDVRVVRRGEVIEVRLTADAYLRRMVRSMVAVLLRVGRGELTGADVRRLLGDRQRALHGEAAPARGLTLERVLYRSGVRSNGRESRRAAGRRTS
jgi:tRNA pseudouridine38-40 synthase